MVSIVIIVIYALYAHMLHVGRQRERLFIDADHAPAIVQHLITKYISTVHLPKSLDKFVPSPLRKHTASITANILGNSAVQW